MLFLRNISSSRDTFPACPPDEGGICYEAQSLTYNRMPFPLLTSRFPRKGIASSATVLLLFPFAFALGSSQPVIPANEGSVTEPLPFNYNRSNSDIGDFCVKKSGIFLINIRMVMATE